jgi:hypothetical protein
LIDSTIFYQTGRCGQLAEFEWADSKGIEWDFVVAANYAAFGWKLKVLEWMREHGAMGLVVGLSGIVF